MKNREARTQATNGIPRPTSYHILIRPDYVEEVTKSGIILTNYENQLDYEQNAACTGVVLAIGPTAWKSIDDGQPWCEVGDRVHFKKHVADMMPDPEAEDTPGKERRKLFLMTDQNILGVYDE